MELNDNTEHAGFSHLTTQEDTCRFAGQNQVLVLWREEAREMRRAVCWQGYLSRSCSWRCCTGRTAGMLLDPSPQQ